MLLAIAAVGRKVLLYKSLAPFLPRKYNFGKRRNTLRDTLSLLEERGAKTLVETGTARHGLKKSKGDGASTVVFGLWAARHEAHLYSVDIEPKAVQQAQEALKEMGIERSVTLVASDSVAYLAGFERPVDFLYLDSFDYHKSDEAIQKASQQHHLDEILAIEDRLHKDSVVLIDDCDQPNGGKGKLVIEHLTQRGWTVFKSEYQVILLPETA